MTNSTPTYSSGNSDILVTLPLQPFIDNSQYFMGSEQPIRGGVLFQPRARVDNSLYSMGELLAQRLIEALEFTTTTYTSEPEPLIVYEIRQPLRTAKVKLRIRSVRRAELQHQLSDFAQWLLDGED